MSQRSPISRVAMIAMIFACGQLNNQSPVIAGPPTPADSGANKTIRIGIIGLDTSHAGAFTKVLNDPSAKADVAGCRVVAAYPKGSPDIVSSVSRVPRYTEQMKARGVKIVDSIDELLKHVDAVLLETNDGRPHLEQALPVLKAGKPMFIDKPLAGDLVDAVAIFEAAKKYNTPVFSSSSLRFGAKTQAARGGALGTIKRCETHSPASKEKTHPDLYWYGIHGVESLFTAMGPGCQTVTRTQEDGKIVVTGAWRGGRVGVYREGRGYGGHAKGSKGQGPVGTFDGYRPLVVEIVRFFKTGKPPVEPQETLEIYAFMSAADVSKARGGKPVSLQEVLADARKKAPLRLAEVEKR